MLRGLISTTFMKMKHLVAAFIVGILLTGAAFSLSSFSIRNEEVANTPISTASTKPAVATPIPMHSLNPGIYKQAIAQAMSAANLVQSASSQDDWKLVVNRWQKSISLLTTLLGLMAHPETLRFLAR